MLALGASQCGSALARAAPAASSMLRRVSTSSHLSTGKGADDDAPDFAYDPLGVSQRRVSVVHKLGLEVLTSPWHNKGTGFPMSERERLGLRGLLPPRVISLEMQERRFMRDYDGGVDLLIAPEEVESGGVTHEMARKWKLLNGLQDRNETLFYRVLIDNFVDMAPIIYTPTVGWVCVNHHHLFRRPRGMYFSAADRDEMAAMVYNWPQDDVHAIVVTDGSRILGLGDLGCNGLGISVGKLDLYCAAAGFSPAKVLPCVIDVGTDNSKLRSDPLYLGLDKPRMRGREYYEIVDEFVAAVMTRWPNAVLQFEDFSIEHARPLLERYRHDHLMFNDDIQGTAATALSGVLGALRVLGKPAAELSRQRIVVLGAGSAGMGVVKMIADGMVAQGALMEEAASAFHVIDADGLVTRARGHLPKHVKLFARGDELEFEGEPLMDVVRRVKPTVLLGLAGAGRLFTADVLRAMGEGCERPIIFPMSNPISKMECTAEEAYAATDGRCVFASGSPQPPVELGGVTYAPSQSNNLHIFPGIALGGFLGETGVITDAMLMAAAKLLPRLISDEDVAAGKVYPRLQDIRETSVKVACEVIKTAAMQGNVGSSAAHEALARGDASLAHWIRTQMFNPRGYPPLAYLRPGVGE